MTGIVILGIIIALLTSVALQILSQRMFREISNYGPLGVYAAVGSCLLMYFGLHIAGAYFGKATEANSTFAYIPIFVLISCVLISFALQHLAIYLDYEKKYNWTDTNFTPIIIFFSILILFIPLYIVLYLMPI